MNVNVVFSRIAPQFNLSQDLVGERVAHDERRMSVGTSQVDKSAFSQDDDVSAVVQGISVNL